MSSEFTGLALPQHRSLIQCKLVQLVGFYSVEASGYGCKIGQHYFGALCPTLYGFQQMLNICQKFGEEYNPAKSVSLCVNRRQQPLPNIFLAGQAITWVSSVKHLGNFIQADLSEKTEVINKRGDFIGRVNGLLAPELMTF